VFHKNKNVLDSFEHAIIVLPNSGKQLSL